jgi:hypothetical protein
MALLVLRPEDQRTPDQNRSALRLVVEQPTDEDIR